MSNSPPFFPPPEPPFDAEDAGRQAAHESSPAVTSHTTAPTGTPWPASRRRTLILGIVAASVGVITAIVVGLVTLASAVVTAIDDAGLLTGEPPPLVQGPPPQTSPLTPDVCDDPCFTVSSIDQARLDPQVYINGGLSVLYGGMGSQPQTQGAEEFDVAANGWSLDNGAPDDCFVTFSDTPLAYALDVSPAPANDSIHFIGSRGSDDELSVTSHTLRLFESSDAAQQHLTDLERLVDGCTQYRLGTQWSATVTPAPALDLPPSVAGVGWVEVEQFGWRYYAFDLMRGNAVMRLTLSTDTGIAEEAFRTLVEEAAVDMAAWPLEQEEAGER